MELEDQLVSQSDRIGTLKTIRLLDKHVHEKPKESGVQNVKISERYFPRVNNNYCQHIHQDRVQMARYPVSGLGQLPPIPHQDRDSPSHHRQSRQNYYGMPRFDEFPSQTDLAGSSSPHYAGVAPWHDKYNQGVLQDHIQTVTAAIKKITKEIEGIEDQLHNRERVSEHTSNTLKSLEMQYVGTISDLRQRVGRCDISIAKLSGDSRRIAEAVANFNKRIQDNNAHHGEAVGELESKITKLESQLGKFTTEQHSKVDLVENESKHTLSLLETKIKNQMDELQRALDTMCMKEESNRHLMEKELATMAEVAISKRDSKQERFEQKMLDRFDNIEKKLTLQEGNMQAQVDKLQAQLDERMKKLERKLQQERESLTSEVRRDLDGMAEQNDSGFKRVKDSMATMRIVLEGKQQLLAENLQKQLANVKKLVVLT